VAVVGAVLLLAPASAGARTEKLAPPGNSAIGQYLEVVPTAGGGRPTGSVQSGGGSGALSPSTQRTFDRDGAAGRAAAALAKATAPSAAKRGKSAAGAGGSGSSPLSTLLKSATGSTPGGGLGPWLPAILIVAAVGGGALAVGRALIRRST
jgi:hypothetical protein